MRFMKLSVGLSFESGIIWWIQLDEMRLEIGTIDDDKETIETMKLKLTGCEQVISFWL